MCVLTELTYFFVVSIVIDIFSFKIELDKEFLICVMVEQNPETSCLICLDPYSKKYSKSIYKITIKK